MSSIIMSSSRLGPAANVWKFRVVPLPLHKNNQRCGSLEAQCYSSSINRSMHTIPYVSKTTGSNIDNRIKSKTSYGNSTDKNYNGKYRSLCTLLFNVTELGVVQNKTYYGCHNLFYENKIDSDDITLSSTTMNGLCSATKSTTGSASLSHSYLDNSPLYFNSRALLSSSVCNVLQNRLIHTSSQFSVSDNRSAGLNVFDRHAKLMQRERAAAGEDVEVYDYLKDEVGYRLSDRIYDIKKEMKVGFDLGCGRGHLSKNFTDAILSHLYMGEFSPSTLASAAVPKFPNLKVEKLCIDEEKTLPFEDKHLDIVLSNLSLHWVNNLPGCLREVYRSLKADGVFLASMFGGDTLYQLRSSLLLAEMEREGGMSPHVSPFTEAQDIGALLGQAGFESLTIDTEDITVGYPSMFELLKDLQGMAENNASTTRKPHIARDTLLAAAAIYQEMYGLEEGIPATFQIIYMIGWKPNPSGAVKPAPRGSGEVSLKDLGRLDELIKERGIAGKVDFIKEMAEGDKKDKKD